MRVLIAEDNRDVASTLVEMIQASENEVVETVGSGLEAIHAYDRLMPDVVVMDYMMTGLNGVTACRNIVAKHPTARVVLVSASLSPRDLGIIRCGACAILRKPVAMEELSDAITNAPPHCGLAH